MLITILPADETHVAQQVPSTVNAAAATAVDVALAPTGSLNATIEDRWETASAGIDVTLVGPLPFESPDVSTTNDGIASNLATDGTGTITRPTTCSRAPTTYRSKVRRLTTPSPSAPGPVIRRYHRHRPCRESERRRPGRGGDPASGVPVSVVVGGLPVASTTTAADGTYQFSLTQTGPVDVVVSSPAVGVLSAAVSATIGSSTTVPTLSAGTGSVRVTVTNGSGPVQGAKINLSSTGAAGGAFGTATNASGVATLANLTPGIYDLGVADGTDAPTSQTVAVGSSGQDITVALGAGATIAGTVTDTNDVAISGADVVAVSGANTVAEVATTATDGTYGLTGLAPGIYSLSISDDEHTPTVVSGVMATAGSSADGNASLASTGSTLTLTLSPAGGSTVLPAVLVGVEDSTGTVVRSAELGPAHRAPSDLSATQAIAGLEPGPYTLLVEQGGAAPITQAVTLAGGGSTVAVSTPGAESLLSLPAAEVVVAAP